MNTRAIDVNLAFFVRLSVGLLSKIKVEKLEIKNTKFGQTLPFRYTDKILKTRYRKSNPPTILVYDIVC